MARPKKNAEPEVLDIPDIKRTRPELPVRCGDCVFLTRYQTYGRPCAKYGTVPSSEPCARFSADPSALGNYPDAHAVLRVLAGAQRPAVLTAIMLGARRVKRLGRVVGDVVYFKVMGGDYLCNYAQGVVTGAARTDLVVMGSHGFTALMRPEALLTRAEYETKRSRLVRTGKINDPAGGLRKISVRGQDRLVHYEPPEARQRPRPKGPRSSFDGRKKSSRSGATVVLSGGSRRQST